MSVISLFPIFFCSYVLAIEVKDRNQSKQGIPEFGGWIGMSNPYGGGHEQLMLINSDWKELKLPPIDLTQKGLNDGPAYGGAPLIPLSGENILSSIPIFISKHVILEKPIPQPIYFEKPFDMPIPVEKIVQEPVKVPVPATPVPLERTIPVKEPMAEPVQQLYPIPVKQTFPVPMSVQSPPTTVAPVAYDARGHGGGQLYPPLPARFVHSFGAGFPHGFGHGFGRGFGHGFGPGFNRNYSHGHGYGYPPLSYARNYSHGREFKKPGSN